MFDSDKKTDSKVRFQRRSFRDQLDQARNYKRGNRPLPAPKENRFWQLLGMGSAWTKILALLGLTAVVYLIYVPNFFYLKKISVSGLNRQKTSEVNLLLVQFFTAQKLWPQNNLLLLSDGKLSQFLLANDKDVLSINSISKGWLARSLDITVQARQLEFFVSAPEGSYTISNDGLVETAPSGTNSSALPRISILTENAVHNGEKFSNNDQLSAIRLLEQQLPQLQDDPVDHYEVADSLQPDITVYTKSGVKLLFDYKDSDLNGTLEKFHLLLTSIAPQDAKHLVYVDMRIKNRSYVCLQNLPCAKSPDISISGTSATSTPTSTASSTLNNLP